MEWSCFHHNLLPQMINCTEMSLFCYTNAIRSWFDTKSLIPWSFRLGVGDNPFPRYNNITFQIINSDFHICETRHVYLSSEIWAMNFLSILWLLLMAEIWYLAPASPSPALSATQISHQIWSMDPQMMLAWLLAQVANMDGILECWWVSIFVLFWVTEHCNDDMLYRLSMVAIIS